MSFSVLPTHIKQVVFSFWSMEKEIKERLDGFGYCWAVMDKIRSDYGLEEWHQLSDKDRRNYLLRTIKNPEDKTAVFNLLMKQSYKNWFINWAPAVYKMSWQRWKNDIESPWMIYQPIRSLLCYYDEELGKMNLNVVLLKCQYD